MMYESPIKMITDDIVKDIMKKQDDVLIEVVHRVGFDVNKEELEKALLYDRNQWERGYTDGKMDGYKLRDAEIVRCMECQYLSEDTIAPDWQRICRWHGFGKSENGYCDEGKRKETEDA